MNTASEYIKVGGFLGFSSVFLLVLVRDRDIVAAVFDGSIACVVMAYAFRLLYSYTVSLRNQVVRERQAVMLQESNASAIKSLSDSKFES